MVVGIITTIIACFPFVFSQLLGFLGIMGLMLAPVGAIIVAEHWLFPKLGFTRYWSKYQGNNTNKAAMVTWLLSLGVSYTLVVTDVLHMFFILLPIWIFATLVYSGLASMMGAKETYPEADAAEQKELARKEAEVVYLSSATSSDKATSNNDVPAEAKLAKYISWAALAACAYMGVMSYITQDIETVRTWLIAPTLVYFFTATYAYLAQNSHEEIPVEVTGNNAA